MEEVDEIDLKEILEKFWVKKIPILLIIVVFILIGVIYTLKFVKPVYTSSTTLALVTSEDSTSSKNTITSTDVTLNSKLVSTYSELIKSKNVVRQAISNLGININEEEVQKNINVSSISNTELIKISVTTGDAETSAQIANEITNVFSEKVRGIYNINNVHVLEKAKVNETPSNINHAKDVIMFACIGVVIAIVYVIISSMLDSTIKTAEDVEKKFKVPVLATIPIYSFDNKKGGKKK